MDTCYYCLQKALHILLFIFKTYLRKHPFIYSSPAYNINFGELASSMKIINREEMKSGEGTNEWLHAGLLMPDVLHLFIMRI